jgi:hypothetical protein
LHRKGDFIGGKGFPPLEMISFPNLSWHTKLINCKIVSCLFALITKYNQSHSSEKTVELDQAIAE